VYDSRNGELLARNADFLMEPLAASFTVARPCPTLNELSLVSQWCASSLGLSLFPSFISISSASPSPFRCAHSPQTSLRCVIVYRNPAEQIAKTTSNPHSLTASAAPVSGFAQITLSGLPLSGRAPLYVRRLGTPDEG
jgi:hypothetical protein